jgi:hypothetical protein
MSLPYPRSAERTDLNASHPRTMVLQWLAALSPVLIVLFFGFFMFREAIVHSIASTPHPELVYVILGAFFCGVILTCITLFRYTLESNLISRWIDTPALYRENLLATKTWHSYLLPVYQILLGTRPLLAGTHQAVLEQEISAVNARLSDRLSLPNHLAGALVGLGLVGTFIGLLGTLEDLSHLFGALADTSNANVNPTEMFADMVRRLQDPMRGMGTAFIASLYGLLGSLVLGLQILAVGKMGHGLDTQIHALVRRNDAFTQPGGSVLAGADAAASSGPSARWEEVSLQMQQHHVRSLEEAQLLRREVLNVIESSKSLTLAVRDSIQADDRYRSSMPRTTYWQDAWVKVQAYLQRSNTDQTLTELCRVSLMHSHTLADIASTLTRIDQRLGAHLNAQFTNASNDK